MRLRNLNNVNELHNNFWQCQYYEEYEILWFSYIASVSKFIMPSSVSKYFRFS